MKIEGKFEVSDPERLWGILSSPESAARCIPGLVDFTVNGSEIRARAKVGIGFMKGTFNVTVQVLENNVQARAAKLSLSGTGNLGNFNAIVDVRAETFEGKNVILYSSDAQVSGLLGTVASGILVKRVDEIVKEFIKCTEGSAGQGA